MMDTLQLPTSRTAYRLGKRAFDLMVSVLLLPPAALLGAVIAVLLKVSSPGPVFYRHVRVGRQAKAFHLWKFRTMVHNGEQLFLMHLAENAAARHEWERYRKLRRDPRVTKIGAFLRKTNLDELPQLINVLRGEMSLVGPRPIMLEEMERYGAGSDLYTAVLPGITGMWQVGGRCALPYERRVALDVEYVCTWSFGRDLAILVSTLRALPGGRGAF
jgi:lipopolysaccharide/colanic/teichoic acid biosynthesis glycosyltransferase